MFIIFFFLLFIILIGVFNFRELRFLKLVKDLLVIKGREIVFYWLMLVMKDLNQSKVFEEVIYKVLVNS